MNKKIMPWIGVSVIVIVFIILSIVGYNIFFPYADPFVKPPVDQLFRVTVLATGCSADVEYEVAFEFFEAIGEPKPTRRQSVNDSPYNDTYCSLEVLNGETLYKYYVYIIEDTIFLEQPYVGVYEISKSGYDLLKANLPQ